MTEGLPMHGRLEILLCGAHVGDKDHSRQQHSGQQPLSATRTHDAGLRLHHADIQQQTATSM
jgi:hypothetical protein